MSLLNLGATALNAAYTQVQVTGHNIANVNTPGFHKQVAMQESVPGAKTGSGYVGRGVAITTIQRQYDSFLETEVSVTQASASADKARADQMASLDRMFANTDTGIGAGIDDMRSAMADLVNAPSDSSVRAVVMQRATSLAAQVRDTAGQLDQMGSEVNQRIQGAATKLNNLLTNLGTLNNRISQGMSSGKTPNDLLDQRDSMIGQVNELIGASSYAMPDGTVNLYATGGQALLVNTTASQFAVTTDPVDPTKSALVLKTAGNNVPIDSSMINGGEISGLMKFRDEDLASARFRIGQIAGAMATAFNAQQALGVDASGTAGQPMFAVGAPNFGSATDNTGSATLGVTVASGSALQASDYTLQWTGTAYQATRESDGQQTLLGPLPQTLDGLTISTLSGTPAAGDRFMLHSAGVMAAGFSMALTSGSRIAAGVAALPVTGSANQGDVAVGAFTVNSAAANLSAPVTLTFTAAGTFDVSGTGTGNPTGVTYTAGQPITYNGWTLNLKGTPKAGDTVTIQPTASPATDNRNVKAMLGVFDQRIAGGVTANDAYADLLSDVGTRSSTAATSQTMSLQSLNDAKLARDSASGVSLDEEAAHLLQYQQAYQAAAKLIATAQSMFDSVMQAMG
jgi:flagellar hook-associated protein 1